jgi:hypothetical protein
MMLEAEATAVTAPWNLMGDTMFTTPPGASPTRPTSSPPRTPSSGSHRCWPIRPPSPPRPEAPTGSAQGKVALITGAARLRHSKPWEDLGAWHL